MGKAEHPIIAIPGPLWPGVEVPDKVLSMGQIELKCVLMLNWIVWNRTVYCIRWIWHSITYNGWYAIKPNQIKLNSFMFWRFCFRLLKIIELKNHIYMCVCVCVRERERERQRENERERERERESWSKGEIKSDGMRKKNHIDVFHKN